MRMRLREDLLMLEEVSTKKLFEIRRKNHTQLLIFILDKRNKIANDDPNELHFNALK